MSVSAIPSSPTSRANCSALGSMCGNGLEWSAMASMSKRTAPGMWPAVLGRGVALQRRKIVGAVDRDGIGAPRRAASQSVLTSQREEGLSFAISELFVSIVRALQANAIRTRRFSLPFFSICVTRARRRSRWSCAHGCRRTAAGRSPRSRSAAPGRYRAAVSPMVLTRPGLASSSRR